MTFKQNTTSVLTKLNLNKIAVLQDAEHSRVGGLHRNVGQREPGFGGSVAGHPPGPAQFQRLHFAQIVQSGQGHDPTAQRGNVSRSSVGYGRT